MIQLVEFGHRTKRNRRGLFSQSGLHKALKYLQKVDTVLRKRQIVETNRDKKVDHCQI